MEGVTFITDEIGNKTHVLIELKLHADLLRKFFRKTGLSPEGTAPITPRKLRLTEVGELVPLQVDQEVAAIRAEHQARINALEAMIAEQTEKIEELDEKIDAYEDRVEAYEQEKRAHEEAQLRHESQAVAETGKRLPIEGTSKEEAKAAKKVKVKEILQKAESLMGTKHVIGGLGADGIDCSGLTTVSFKAAGIALPRTSGRQAEVGKPVEAKEKLKSGDLVFFDSGKPGKLNHVGIVHETSNPNDVKFIHTSTSRGVMISSLSNGFWATCYLKGQRIV